VCLETGNQASRHKTSTENRGENDPKAAKNSLPEQHQMEISGFSAACLAVEKQDLPFFHNL